MMQEGNFKGKKPAGGRGSDKANPLGHKGPLTDSYALALKDRGALKKCVLEVLQRQQVPANDGTVERLISLIEALYSVPSPETIKEKAREHKIVLTENEIKIMAWVLQAFQELVNRLAGHEGESGLQQK